MGTGESVPYEQRTREAQAARDARSRGVYGVVVEEPYLLGSLSNRERARVKRELAEMAAEASA